MPLKTNNLSIEIISEPCNENKVGGHKDPEFNCQNQEGDAPRMAGLDGKRHLNEVEKKV